MNDEMRRPYVVNDSGDFPASQVTREAVTLHAACDISLVVYSSSPREVDLCDLTSEGGRVTASAEPHPVLAKAGGAWEYCDSVAVRNFRHENT